MGVKIRKAPGVELAPSDRQTLLRPWVNDVALKQSSAGAFVDLNSGERPSK
jgi:hypothetical protein